MNSALEQGPKAMLILLTHSQANRLKKSVRDKRRVDIRRIDRHLSLVMWSAIATDAETIRRTVNAAYRLPFTDPFMLAALLAIAVFSAAFGGIALWSFLAYEPLGKPISLSRGCITSQNGQTVAPWPTPKPGLPKGLRISPKLVASYLRAQFGSNTLPKTPIASLHSSSLAL